MRYWMFVAVALSILISGTNVTAQEDFRIDPDEKSVQFSVPQATLALVETSEFIRAVLARDKYKVNGRDLTAAVLDTGLNLKHEDFTGKILAQHNFTTDNMGQVDNATDGNGHGTNVGGIIVANGIHTGIAPGGRIVPLKVLSNGGSGGWGGMIKALEWVQTNADTHKITVVNISISDGQNHVADTFVTERKKIRDLIAALREKRIPVVVSAGNDFFVHQSKQGMGFPAICRETISVGAVYDANIGGAVTYKSGAIATTTGAGRYTPFSQRLHSSVDANLATDIFAPGAPLTSAGIQGTQGESIQHGTSQAAPVVSGVILLLQEYYRKSAEELPTAEQLERWIRPGTLAKDGDDEDDNVTNTNLDFGYIDAMKALGNADGEIRQMLLDGRLKPRS